MTDSSATPPDDQAGIDLDEPPLFDLDATHEPDEHDDDSDGADDDSDGIEAKGSNPEGVPLPFDVLEFGNGELPDELLHPIGIGPHRLHAAAAAGFAKLRELAAAAGIDLTCTDSYRTLSQQRQLKDMKPATSATPGRSVHGWGFAVDVSIGMPPKPFGQSVYRWLQDNGPPNGWFLGRPKDEPWHWVYRGVGDIASSSTGATTAAPNRVATASTTAATAPVAASDLDPAAVGSTEISLGATGVAAKILRDLLGLPAGDSFDAPVDEAVRAFQQAHALTVDGKVGPKTWAALRSSTAPADRPELARDATGDAVAWVQRRLGITSDGKFGPRTEASVRAFQQARGLTADGKIGPKTWAALLA